MVVNGASVVATANVLHAVLDYTLPFVSKNLISLEVSANPVRGAKYLALFDEAVGG